MTLEDIGRLALTYDQLRREAARKDSSSEIAPSVSKSAAGSVSTAAKCEPKRVRLCSLPLRVAVMIMRPGAESFAMNGALEEPELTITTGRRIGFIHAARSSSDMSGPCRLKRATFPSHVPWPFSTSHNGS